MERRAEKKRMKEEEEKREMEGLLEDEPQGDQLEEEEGAALEDDLEDGGDVEYGDTVRDEDEPDQDDATMQEEA